jgi:hypothetical protein
MASQTAEKGTVMKGHGFTGCEKRLNFERHGLSRAITAIE